jgi:hypothetical protein
MPAAFAPFVGTAGMSASFSAAMTAAMSQPAGVQGGQSSNASLGPKLSANPDASADKSVTQAKPGASFITADYARYIGRSVGSGQCVALAQATNPSIGPTRNWQCGVPVQGNTELRPGTIIATFDSSDRYSNALDGSSHAAIYLGQNERGIQVMDQWAGNTAVARTIPWTNPSGVAANTGTAFHVVQS